MSEYMNKEVIKAIDGLWSLSIQMSVPDYETSNKYRRILTEALQWQPLITIPKNEKVLLWMPNKYVLGHVCCGIADPENYEKGIYWFYDDDESAGMVPVHHATHWQPIFPPAPQGDE